MIRKNMEYFGSFSSLKEALSHLMPVRIQKEGLIFDKDSFNISPW
jgi:hypothetical protein